MELGFLNIASQSGTTWKEQRVGGRKHRTRAFCILLPSPQSARGDKGGEARRRVPDEKERGWRDGVTSGTLVLSCATSGKPMQGLSTCQEQSRTSNAIVKKRSSKHNKQKKTKQEEEEVDDINESNGNHIQQEQRELTMSKQRKDANASKHGQIHDCARVARMPAWEGNEEH